MRPTVRPHTLIAFSPQGCRTQPNKLSPTKSDRKRQSAACQRRASEPAAMAPSIFRPNINERTCVAAASPRAELRRALSSSWLSALAEEVQPAKRLQRTWTFDAEEQQKVSPSVGVAPNIRSSLRLIHPGQPGLSPRCPFLPTPLCLLFSADWLHLAGNDFMF